MSFANVLKNISICLMILALLNARFAEQAAKNIDTNKKQTSSVRYFFCNFQFKIFTKRLFFSFLEPNQHQKN